MTCITYKAGTLAADASELCGSLRVAYAGKIKIHFVNTERYRAVWAFAGNLDVKPLVKAFIEAGHVGTTERPPQGSDYAACVYYRKPCCDTIRHARFTQHYATAYPDEYMHTCAAEGSHTEFAEGAMYAGLNAVDALALVSQHYPLIGDVIAYCDVARTLDAGKLELRYVRAYTGAAGKRHTAPCNLDGTPLYGKREPVQQELPLVLDKAAFLGELRRPATEIDDQVSELRRAVIAMGG